MQRHNNTIGSGNSGMNQDNSFINRPNTVENRLSNCVGSSEQSCVNSNSHDVQSFNGWNSDVPSSTLSLQNQVNDDGTKGENGWSSSISAQCSTGFRSEERALGPTSALFPERDSIGFSGSQVRSDLLFLHGSSSNHSPQNVTHAAHIGNSGIGWEGIGPNLYRRHGVETERTSSSSAPNNIGSSSGSSCYRVQEGSGSSGSSGVLGSSCKRKALEGTSSQPYPSGSPTFFPQAENDAWHAGPPGPAAFHDASSSLRLSTHMQSSSTYLPEQLNPGIGVGMRGIVPDGFPSASGSRNVETALRNFGRRVSPSSNLELPFNLSSARGARQSNVSPHQSSRPVSFNDSLDLRSMPAASANLSSLQSSHPAVYISGSSRNLHPFPWNGASNPRADNLSSSFFRGERGAVAQEEVTVRNISRPTPEHPMFVPASEVRNMVQDPASWNMASGNLNTSGNVPSSSRIGSSSSIHPLPTSSLIQNHNSLAHNQQRLLEFSPWSLFPSYEAESGGLAAHFSPLSSSHSASSQDSAMSSGMGSQDHHQPNRRSMERQGDSVLGMFHSLQALAADIEGRRRLTSEIHQVLNTMLSRENVQLEDYISFDEFLSGLAEMHDRHRDMRLDVDNMSYEELLALGERIGDVSTGLSEDTIWKLMKHRKYVCITAEPPSDLEPCCVCQEPYLNGDDIGNLPCGHEFHTNCIKEWLMRKNICPICKTPALNP
ncbi:E3 ubiquitin-protein ligase MBR2-like isoform X1 [Tripterygium wilfordii]|uniref:RING-type E3 ubiquitin transferase n=1 Tax=Tripterygium wilfordii TaxID=458696 RepID=A0A7J7DYD4_TRIWF|nr:E3 ubiquitin-protein ligase MBR2-like [Tripterygium wilfordii]KAF5751194.1 E3 ubiquitin-protein ligase MBR2-like isoform X1 [Tripterygium wilfordii]